MKYAIRIRPVCRYLKPIGLLLLVAVVAFFNPVKVFSQEPAQPDTKSLLGKWECNYHDFLDYKAILWIEEFDNKITARLKYIGTDDDGEKYITYPRYIETSINNGNISFCFECNVYYDAEGIYNLYHKMINVEYWTVSRQGAALNVDVVQKNFYYIDKNATWYDMEDGGRTYNRTFYPEGDDW